MEAKTAKTILNRHESQYFRFERIAVLHSGLSDGEKYDEYRRISKGEVKLVVGARSAIFAPVSNVKLIIIDEEHDSSYKSETMAWISSV